MIRSRDDEMVRVARTDKIGFSNRDPVWLYIPKVQPELIRGMDPFESRMSTIISSQIEDTGYRVNPWVQISRLKPRALFPKRPTIMIEISESEDFDAALLPDDSWASDQYEVKFFGSEMDQTDAHFQTKTRIPDQVERI
ncbi:LOW QUALITY PROTEIN: hypothetical protein PHMEG_00017414 [Phytophthora megakarya]|uniref:Reverse transcriptase n=1 Tax=Phytophthora megakarya TaxID=4795 RepID=A0A225VWV3_9STRA|nr:LOW QUALITY PROTEIN: hypothetical protein PHMEG_00017414 [Phytophthora megakarya]